VLAFISFKKLSTKIRVW